MTKANKIDTSKLKDGSKDWLLQTCFGRFGAMQKTEYETTLFHVLILNGYGDKTDFELSRLLRISEARIRNLRYKCSLEYPVDDEYDEQLRNLLGNAVYKWDGNRIQFCIPDQMLRLYTNNLLAEKNSFSDSSFNSSIVSVSPMDMMEILETLCDTKSLKGKTEFDELCKSMKESLRSSEHKLPETTAEKLKEGVVAFAKDMGGKISPMLSSILVDYLRNYLEKKTKKQ
jgi:hypothetical protein